VHVQGIQCSLSRRRCERCGSHTLAVREFPEEAISLPEGGSVTSEEVADVKADLFGQIPRS
jgi:hypothetical protein